MSWNIRKNDVYYGFRKGLLADYTGAERLSKQASELRYSYASHNRLLNMRHSRQRPAEMRMSPNTKAPVGSSLEDTLEATTLTTLRRAARFFDIRSASKAPHAQLVTEIRDVLMSSSAAFEQLLSNIDDESYAQLIKALGGETIEYATAPRSALAIPDLSPFVFASLDGASIHAYMPPDLREHLAQLDTEAIIGKRALRTAVESALHTYLSLCGVCSVDALFAYLQATAGVRPLERGDFDEALRRETVPVGSVRTFEHQGITYVADTRIRDRQPTGSCLYTYEDFGYHDTTYGYKKAPSRPDEFLRLVECHKGLVSRLECTDDPITDVASYVYGLPCVQKLTSYFDAHVPERENDLTFADDMVDYLLSLVLTQKRSIAHVMDWLTQNGWFLSEGSNSSPQLTKLILELYRDAPRWEYNGWSEREYQDLMGLPYLISETRFMDRVEEEEAA